MQKKFYRSVVICFVFGLTGFRTAAQTENFQWWQLDSTTEAAVEGRAWATRADHFSDRLPSRAKGVVPPAVWDLSHHTAGEMIRFRTSARKIIVRYTVNGDIAMPHMPATGVSGVDLFAVDEKGNFQWAPGRFRFKDTIEYSFTDLAANRSGEALFQLYLPLYNSVKWLSIGVPANATFTALEARDTKPIVVYGTSIAQGACASRPGLAWPAVLGRKLNAPVVNLGFSGSGKMEPAVIDLLNEIDARLFILDCMPNLTPSYSIADEEIEKRFTEAVKKIQNKHPGTPVLFAEHSGGFAANYLDKGKEKQFGAASLLINKIFKKLRQGGMRNIYLLTAKEIGFDTNATVDGLHPNDMGMMLYAAAYEKRIRQIFAAKKKR